MARATYINSLWPSGIVWHHRTESTLVQVLACCLKVPSHYLNQWWFIIWHQRGCVAFPWEQYHAHEILRISICERSFKIITTSTKGQCVKGEQHQLDDKALKLCVRTSVYWIIASSLNSTNKEQTLIRYVYLMMENSWLILTSQQEVSMIWLLYIYW